MLTTVNSSNSLLPIENDLPNNCLMFTNLIKQIIQDLNLQDLSCNISKKSDPIPASTVAFFPKENGFLVGMIA